MITDGGMDMSAWLTQLFADLPSRPLVSGVVKPGLGWPQQSTYQATPSPEGTMPISPEMGGGAQRMLGAGTVDALGPQGNAVNAASSIAAGGQPSMMDMLMDKIGINGPGKGMSDAGKRSLLESMIKMMASQQQGQERSSAPAMAPMQAQQVAMLPNPAARPLPVYPWTQRRGLLSE